MSFEERARGKRRVLARIRSVAIFFKSFPCFFFALDDVLWKLIKNETRKIHGWPYDEEIHQGFPPQVRGKLTTKFAQRQR